MASVHGHTGPIQTVTALPLTTTKSSSNNVIFVGTPMCQCHTRVLHQLNLVIFEVLSGMNFWNWVAGDAPVHYEHTFKRG